jgi:hypothetical protein
MFNIAIKLLKYFLIGKMIMICSDQINVKNPGKYNTIGIYFTASYK